MALDIASIITFVVLVTQAHCEYASVPAEVQSDEEQHQDKWLQKFSSVASSFEGSYRVTWESVLRRPSRFAPKDTQSGRHYSQLCQFMDAVNEKYAASRETSWQDAMKDKEGAFKVAAAFWTTESGGNADSFPATLVTSASSCRLHQLMAQCLNWAGPLSATVYLSLTGNGGGQILRGNREHIRNAVMKIAEFLVEVQQVPHACQPDIHLVYELHHDSHARRLLYPFNVLRNLARLQARTPLVVMLDVDLLPSRSLYTRLQDAYNADQIMRQATDKTVYIIPAFDISEGHEKAAWAEALVTAGKPMLVEAYKKHIAFPFAFDIYPQGHNMTDFKKWVNVNVDYVVPHMEGCEPWVLGDRLSLPWFDDRFRGYGSDKVEFLLDLAMRKYTFKVLSDAYIIHRAHPKSEASVKFQAGFRRKKPDQLGAAICRHNTALYKVMLNDQKKGKVWVPVVNTAVQHAIDVLPWWREGRGRYQYKQSNN